MFLLIIKLYIEVWFLGHGLKLSWHVFVAFELDFNPNPTCQLCLMLSNLDESSSLQQGGWCTVHYCTVEETVVRSWVCGTIFLYRVLETILNSISRVSYSRTLEAIVLYLISTVEFDNSYFLKFVSPCELLNEENWVLD